MLYVANPDITNVTQAFLSSHVYFEPYAAVS